MRAAYRQYTLFGLILLMLMMVVVGCASAKTKRVRVVPASGDAGAKVTVRGHGLKAKQPVRIYVLGKKIGKAKTSKRGTFKRSVTMPSGHAGTLVLRVYVGPWKKKRRYSTTYVASSTDTGGGGSSSSGGETSSDPVIMTVGDIACAPSDGINLCQQAATAALVQAENPTGVLILGDNQYESGTLSDYQNSFALSWGQLTAPIYPVPGNHEYNTANAQGYYDYFGSSAGDPAKGYYSYDIGNWHLIALNTNNIATNSSPDCAVVGCAAGSEQEQWLRSDLAAHSNSCTLAYWHHPRFSSGLEHGNYTTVKPLWDALYEYNADVVLNGHDNDYERFALQDSSGTSDAARGIREFVVGTGGKSLYGLGTLKDNSDVFYNSTMGVLKLTLHSDSYDWQYIPTSGSFTDSGTDSCH